MADQDQRAVVVGQQVLEQVQRVHVEVVGRFVQHHDIGGLGQGARQQQAVALPAGKAAHRLAQLGLGEQEILGVGDDVARLAAHHDLVAALGQEDVAQRKLRRERPAGLVDIVDLQIGPEFHLAGVWRDLAQQHLDQGCLAGPIRSHNRHAVAAQDAGGEVLQKHLVAERLGDALGLNHALARDAGRRQAHVELAARVLKPVLPVLAQGFQPPPTAFIAGAAGGDAAGHPVLLALDIAVEASRLLGLGRNDLFGPLVEGGETLVQAFHLAVLQPEAALGHAYKERAIMANDQGRGAGRG